MTEATFKLLNPTDYHLQQQQYQQQPPQPTSRPNSFFMDPYSPPAPPGFLSPLLSDLDEYEGKSHPMLDMDMMSEESPSEYSMFSPPQHGHPSYLMDMHQKYTSADTVLSVSPQSPFMYNHPFSAPTQMDYLAALNHKNMEDFESLQLQQQILNEKKRRRRESHNAVERRRRENINERIQELGTMLPESMLEEITSPIGNNSKPNKGAILRKSVDHIRMLQDQVSSYQQRILQLESQLATLTQ
ncbi:Myc-type, basic helix-loop-helix domain-containing protein [Sporodiniella umbellata]|nr:Myc-type, basic helix-loop-helix domain-containing protein [Sporodiniella umbellata]